MPKMFGNNKGKTVSLSATDKVDDDYRKSDQVTDDHEPTAKMTVDESSNCKKTRFLDEKESEFERSIAQLERKYALSGKVILAHEQVLNEHTNKLNEHERRVSEIERILNCRRKGNTSDDSNAADSNDNSVSPATQDEKGDSGPDQYTRASSREVPVYWYAFWDANLRKYSDCLKRDLFAAKAAGHGLYEPKPVWEKDGRFVRFPTEEEIAEYWP